MAHRHGLREEEEDKGYAKSRRVGEEREERKDSRAQAINVANA
jgi:hypothetical protein